MFSSGVFRRETASGFYPWGKVDSPRERVAEGLCGWRHGNSFPMTQNAQSHRQMRSIPRCPKAVFYVFVFLIPFTIRQQCIIYPQKFSTNFLLSTEKGGRGWSPFWIGIGYVSVITLVRIRTLVGHQDRHRLEVDRLDDHRGRLEEVRLGRRHGHPIGSFGWAGCPLRMW